MENFTELKQTCENPNFFEKPQIQQYDAARSREKEESASHHFFVTHLCAQGVPGTCKNTLGLLLMTLAAGAPQDQGTGKSIIFDFGTNTLY